jgi:uncharacterized protein (TIGR01777 family)
MVSNYQEKSMGKTILIAGGTGMIGSALGTHLVSLGHNIIVLSRDPQKHKQKSGQKKGISYAFWDVRKQEIDPDAIKSADAVVHLAGAGVVDKPWTEAYKKEILESRTQTSALLVKGMREHKNSISVVVSQAAIGYYGPDVVEGHAFTEDETTADDFLARTCVIWEDSIRPVEELGKRLVIFRTGIVLSKAGGALAEFKKPLKVRVAAVLGEGSQAVSWIHGDDESRLFAYAIENENLSGVYNAVAPNPVNNETLTVSLAKAMHGNGYIKMHVPEFVLKIMLGERSSEVLKSTTVSAEKILKTGFQFHYPDIDKAMNSLV